MRHRMIRAALLAAFIGAGVGCGDTQLDTSVIRSFDRPVDLAFGCFGRLRILGDNGTPDLDDPVVFSAQPISSCVTRSQAAAPTNAPPGQQDMGTDGLAGSMTWIQVAVQPTSGTISTVKFPEKGLGVALTQGVFEVVDGDPLTPGHNSIAVGALPVAIATDTAGCHALTVNAGSCDVSVIDLTRLALGSTDPLVSALSVQTVRPGPGPEPIREPLLARPSAIASVDLLSPIGVACPARPQGVVYVAYPDCHAVAAIDAETGDVLTSLRFAADGTPTIDPTGALICPRQCGDDREATAAGARPVALDIVRDTPGAARGPDFQRLAIGLDNRPVVTIVDLGPDGLPQSIDTVELEGDIGVIDVALSKQIRMGGDNITGMGNNDHTPDAFGVEAEFVYAVATDSSVRVAEILVAGEECDTQVDPRYLFDERDPTQLVCLVAGQIGTPPRRANATSPGIQFKGQARPVAVTIASANNAVPRLGSPDPALLAGHFAFVALSDGNTVIVNVDDDNYPDTYLPTLPLASVLSLGLPHQIRDSVQLRDADSIDDDGVPICVPVPPFDSGTGAPRGGPRSPSAPARLLIPEVATPTSTVNLARASILPLGHQVLCTGSDLTGPVSVLTYGAPNDVRERVYPDWRTIAVDENWFFTWEGTLSVDGTDTTVDGPVVRSGTVAIAGGGMRVVDAARPFCAAGVEPYDVVTLRGCDPARGDAQCSLDETCYVHPDSKVGTGACLPNDRLEILAGACRDFLISQRRYSAFETFAGELALHERRRVLRTTPASGCTSSEQCSTLANYEATLTSDKQPKDLAEVRSEFTYACEADPSRAPGPNRCVMTCTSDDSCQAGTLCRKASPTDATGHCLEGIVPAPECAAGLQRYDLRGSDSFVVVGDRTGYLHPIVEDVGTGRCIKNPEAGPLLIGRLPLVAPPCSGDEPADIDPNPCAQTVEHVEAMTTWAFTPPPVGAMPSDTGTCTESAIAVQTRSASALRFSNPAFNFTMVDATHPGDARCFRDRAAGLGDIPALFTNFNLRFRLQAGFLAMAAGTPMVQPANIARSPDGAIWVVDSGDIDDQNSNTANVFGQLQRINLSAPGGGFTLR